MESHSENLKVVTLRGEVFYANGPIHAGQEGKPGTLSRPRQRRELSQSLEGLEARLKELNVQLHQFDQVRLELQSEGERVSQEAQRARKQEELAHSAYNQQDLAVEKMRRQLQWQIEQRARTQDELRQGSLEITQVTTDLNGLELDITKARDVLRQQISILAGLSLEESQTNLTHWDTRLSYLERSLDEAEVRCQERQAAFERAGRTQASLRHRLEEIHIGREKLERDKQVFHQQGAQVTAQIETIRAQIEPAEREL